MFPEGGRNRKHCFLAMFPKLQNIVVKISENIKVKSNFCLSHVVDTLQTDVIVNIVASDLNLTKNPCSKAILEEAGSKITTFCEKWIKVHGQVQEGNFAVTDGAQLKCKKVLHVSCPSWTADHGEQVTGYLETQDTLKVVMILNVMVVAIIAMAVCWCLSVVVSIIC